MHSSEEQIKQKMLLICVWTVQGVRNMVTNWQYQRASHLCTPATSATGGMRDWLHTHAYALVKKKCGSLIDVCTYIYLHICDKRAIALLVYHTCCHVWPDQSEKARQFTLSYGRLVTLIPIVVYTFRY